MLSFYIFNGTAHCCNMSSFSTHFLLILLLLLHRHSQSQTVCYELPASDCRQQTNKRCSLWNLNTIEQCVCLMDTSPLNVYFVLDASNTNIDDWYNTIISIPSSFIRQCSSSNTNNVVIQYSNNRTDILTNPSMNELNAWQPSTNGTYSSFCNALLFTQEHISSHNPNNNPVLLILISGNNPSDIDANNQCSFGFDQSSITKTVGIYLNNVQSQQYYKILSYHDAFEWTQSTHSTEYSLITKTLITATICETACDLSLFSTPSPSKKISPRPWLKGRWQRDRKKYDKRLQSSSYSFSSSSSSSSSADSFGYSGFGWNGRYKDGN